MDVLSIIKDEHRTVAALIDEADSCDPGEKRLFDLAREIEKELSAHLAIEERLFYAQLRKQAEHEDQQVDVFEAYTEHEVARRLIDMLKSGRKPDEKFKAELQVLGESVKHHVQEEESTVFGIARKVLGNDDLERIGTAWEKAKRRPAKPARKKTATKKTTRKKTTRKKAARR